MAAGLDVHPRRLAIGPHACTITIEKPIFSQNLRSQYKTTLEPLRLGIRYSAHRLPPLGTPATSCCCSCCSRRILCTQRTQTRRSNFSYSSSGTPTGSHNAYALPPVTRSATTMTAAAAVAHDADAKTGTPTSHSMSKAATGCGTHPRRPSLPMQQQPATPCLLPLLMYPHLQLRVSPLHPADNRRSTEPPKWLFQCWSYKQGAATILLCLPSLFWPPQQQLQQLQ